MLFYFMDLDILFWSKTKVNILKYLLFKEDKISARELESHIQQSFPAIKQQIDNLSDAWIIEKNKKWNRWQLEIKEWVKELIYNIFVYDIKKYLKDIWETTFFIKKIFLADFFAPSIDKKLWIDIVFIHNEVDNEFLSNIKQQISDYLDNYYSDLNISFVWEENYQKRLRFADKFVITLNKYESFNF